MIVPSDWVAILNSADEPKVKSINPVESTVTLVLVIGKSNDPAFGAVAPIGAISNVM